MAAGMAAGRRPAGMGAFMCMAVLWMACVLPYQVHASDAALSGSNVQITQKDFCHACISVVELFFQKTLERAQEARRTYGAQAKVDGTELMDAICKYPVWGKYTPEIAYGCLKIHDEYQADVFGSFNGKHEFGNEEEIYEHKTRVCPNIGACKPLGMVLSTLREPSACGACRAVAQDIEYLLDREQSRKDEKRLRSLVASVCDDLGIRHPQDHKALIEDYCDDILDEAGLRDIVGTYKLRKSMEGSVLRLSQSFADKLCSDMLDMCPKPPTEPTTTAEL